MRGVRVADRGDVVDHVEVDAAVDVDEELAPSALDARRPGVVVLLDLGDDGLAAVEEVVLDGRGRYLDPEREGGVADDGAPPGQIGGADRLGDLVRVERGEQHVDTPAGGHLGAHLRVAVADAQSRRDIERRGPGEPHRSRGRHRRGCVRRAGRRAEQHRAQSREHHDLRSLVEQTLRRALDGVVVEPRPLVRERRQGPGIQDHRPPRLAQERRAGPLGDADGGTPERVTNLRGRHLDRNGGRAPQDRELPIQRAAGVVVRLVEAHLLAPAEDEHDPAQHDERPEGGDLIVRERPPSVERRDGRQSGAIRRAGVVQHRRDRHGDLAHRPRIDDVSEVDDGIGEGLDAVRPEHIVVGHVVVPELARQRLGDRRERGERAGGRLRGERAHIGVGLGLGDLGDRPLGVPQVPLEDAPRGRVRLVRERHAHRGGQLAEPFDDARREVGRAGQRLPRHERDDPRVQPPLRGLPPPRHRAPRSRDDLGDAQGGLRSRDEGGRGILHLDLGFAEDRVADLQHAEWVAPSSGGDEEVLVLLAAERAELRVDAVDLAQQGSSLVDGKGRRRQLTVGEVVERGVGHGGLHEARIGRVGGAAARAFARQACDERAVSEGAGMKHTAYVFGPPDRRRATDHHAANDIAGESRRTSGRRLRHGRRSPPRGRPSHPPGQGHRPHRQNPTAR
ncbi:hypothetical protein QE388_000672 [Microbacterium sp. SORGH_AS 969]|nr:hypothetical protein [Microbacterium sp. SORGH_AS_0969]